MNIKYLNIVLVEKIHEFVIENSGGRTGIINEGQLESVLSHIQNDIYYPNLWDKATHLFHSVASFHCFIDGNKRTAVFSTTLFLEVNTSIPIETTHLFLHSLSILVATNQVSKEQVNIIFENIIKLGKNGLTKILGTIEEKDYEDNLDYLLEIEIPNKILKFLKED